MISKALKITISFISVISLFSCRTIDMETVSQVPEAEEIDSGTMDYLVEDKLKVQDVEDTVFVVEKVVYRPELPVVNTEPKTEPGMETVKESYSQAVVQPADYKNGAIVYQYNENQVYEVYTEPYQLTDIILEPGETVIANPLISEDEQVWELTAGVGRDGTTGESIQHLFLKPVLPGLDSTFIVITDRRTYHFRIMSFDDIHMAMVRFKFSKVKDGWNSTALNTYVSGEFVQATDPNMLSFDYKITYNIFKKPDFLPKRIYDDGKQTYIEVDESVLHKELPVLFNESEELMNYTVKGNLFIVPRLITKATLRLDGKKVTIEKKKTKKED
ncbi:MAG: TrbG/VirB9 family P-type conjugative transfer protein [Spirochaetaceae bacterium]|nr:TrbG/VirB9 family P-type conjugative transfer protein [Spirochaetaceae bacterium]